ncbi:class I adenylate-forming enzyme family protein [Rhodococcoides kroppenstedtii]|uniref:class I adenylate-forming enzyme family protein n=1 Tax=Rhodococcoides kroppenstedtii TaxID=293050 RepID=UPI0028E5F393|nr:AMP-binding protein [Rhodococcus kroppenstedtii]
MLDLESLPATIDEVLHEKVRSFGEKVLLEYPDDDRSFTYAEFSEHVDRAALRLVGAGVQPGECVAVMLPNIPLFPVLTFAMARIGAVCVPINIRYTATELDYVCADAGVNWIVIDDDLRSGVAAAEILSTLPSAHILRPASNNSELEGDVVATTEWLPIPIEFDRVTHIQYTSGTTGFPKGCVLTQDYWVVAAASYGAVRRPSARSLEDSPYFYMSGPLLLMIVIWGGGTVVVPRVPTLRRFLTRVKDLRIDWCWFPQQLLKFPESDLDRDHNIEFASIYMAEPWEVDAIADRFGVQVRDGWSMTETGFGTYVPEDRPDMMRAQSIGIPMPAREFKIVDANLDEVDTGETGELCVRGPGMFRGYHNRPEVNSELIIEGGWFRTGDRARFDEHGHLYYSGRAKDMVRRSGENIACVEVESVIRQLDGVEDCAVLPVPDEWRDEEVKAYVVLDERVTPQTLPPERIFAWASSRLASFKVPRYIEYREELPLTPSDKVAKGVLRNEKDDLRSDSFDRVDDVWR